MEHELRIEGKIFRESKGGGILRAEFAELLAEFDQHSIRPPEHVRRLLALPAEDGQPRHQGGSALLVETHPVPRRGKEKFTSNISGHSPEPSKSIATLLHNGAL